MHAPTPPPPRTHPAAWLSFGLGVLSFVLVLLALTGIPAMILGLRGLRAIHASEGGWRGARLAITGMVLGGLATLITFLGVVAIFLLRAQEGSRRVECANHLRMIGTSLNKYADTHGAFPPATATPPGMPPDRRISWMANVLPLLAEGTSANEPFQVLAAQIDETRPWDDAANSQVARTAVRPFLCPGAGNLRAPVTNYVGMAGIGPNAAERRREDPLAGMFGHDRGVKREEVTAGISFTILVLETAERTGPWLGGGFPTVRGLEPGVSRYCGPGRPFGGLHHEMTMVLWVDGAARPVKDEVPAELLLRAATPRRD